MYMLLELCCVCLANTSKLKEIDILDIDNIKIERKLKYCTTKYKNIRPPIPSYICSKCCRKLRIAYDLKKAYYRSCRILKGYVSQLKRNASGYKNAGQNLQNELQVSIMNLGECMIDGKFSHDLVKIENVETQFVGIVPESITPEIVTNITSIENTITDPAVNNSVEINVSFVFDNEEHLDIDEDAKIFSPGSIKCEAATAETVDHNDGMHISEEEKDAYKIWVENLIGNTSFASPVVQQRVEIKQDTDVVANEATSNFTKDSDELQLNLILEGLTKSEDTGDVCKIWVESTDNVLSENITDSVSSIIVNESADIKEESTGKENTENASVKQKCQSSRKRKKYSNMLTKSSSGNIENNSIPKCVHCNKSFTYKIDLLNYLIAHSYNKPFCSTLCREQYDAMKFLRK